MPCSLFQLLAELTILQKDIGALNMYQMLDGLEAFTSATFTSILGWSIEEVQAFLVRVRQAAKDRSVHILHDLYVNLP